MDRSELRFPEGFLWGVSTSAHQVEGGNENNNWSDWERAGRIRTGERAGLACDWWSNAERDFDLAREMGLNALRLSVEWSRIEPEEGRFDETALLRYRGMMQALRERGIRPFVCLHHFTNPRWFEAKGAFLSDDAVACFERFTDRVAQALGDVCSDWLTFNEPNVYGAFGYMLGEFPPGKAGDFISYFRAVHTLLRAHAAAYRVLHRRSSSANVGFTVNVQRFAPERPRHPGDRLLTRVLERSFNAIFLRGLTPAPGDRSRRRRRTAGDAVGTYDFVGFNHYGWMNVRFEPRHAKFGFIDLKTPHGMREGDPGIESGYGGFDPHGLAVIAEELAPMGKPILVMEHGIPDREDRLRPWLLAGAAAALHEAVRKGVDVRGYFHWTLVDNFEWAQGWRLRFGLVELDPVTQVRRPRRSAGLYSAVARANALRREDLRLHAPETLEEWFPETPRPTTDEASFAPGGVRAPIAES
ncbi:MAG TPA: family 1 glycosylhydrolase [Myxococcaceae bacterium]|nr:family 1 glycosylhydrolase [Myxococcaceae bacterium]